MRMDHQAYSLEVQYLSDTISAAQMEVEELQQKAEAMYESILEAKREMQGETSNSIGNLWASDAFEQLVELSQFATEISRDMDSYENTVKEIETLNKLMQSPYFARIDFALPEEGTPRRIYIGRTTLMRGYDIYVYDWRAPIASMFYRFGTGSAFYTAPAGAIHGTVSLKRQYEIKRGELLFFFDADIEILDEYLRKMLSQNSSPQMKSIVETIQREQDVAIRDMEHDVLAVQGVAGSGKTSIALHRIAYLMYNSLSSALGSQNVLILSPNAVFETYIANVLPELGEESVQSYLLDELLQLALDMPHIQTRHDLLEAFMTDAGEWTSIMKSSLAFKCSSGFKKLLDGIGTPGGSAQEVLHTYRSLFDDTSRFYEAAGNIPLPACIADILRLTRENLQSATLPFDDASALAYLYLKQNGCDAFRHIRQVVVDEAQDYYPLHFELLRLLFPHAQYTLLGDVAQTISKPETAEFYQGVMRTLSKKSSALVSLEKSFRCSNEITRFSADILGVTIPAFGREGERPVVHRLESGGDCTPLVQQIEAAKATGYQSIGILCKSRQECQRLYDALHGRVELTLLQDAVEATLTGVLLLPIYLSKGLEFDAVFLWGADSSQYHAEADRSLLYIACTRALHRLHLFHAGEPSIFLSAACQ